MLLLSFCTCARQGPPSFDPDSAWAHLLAQCELGPRFPGSDAHRRMVPWLEKQLENSGCEVELQPFSLEDPYGDGRLQLTNVIARIEPDRSKRFLLAAHFDTRPRADNEKADSLKAKPIIGANDGASGVAVLLELARLVGSHPPEGLGVDIVFFDGEDYGKQGSLEFYLLGSKYFAANLPQPEGYHPVGGVLLDMVGAKGAKIYEELNSLAAAPELTRTLFARAEKLGLDVFESERGTAIYDDHIPLLTAGMKCVDLIDTTYPYWHTLEDTPDKCSKETLGQVGTLLVDFLYNFPF